MWFAAAPERDVLLPLRSLVEAGAPRTKRALLVAVVKRQQGIGAQTLLKRQINYSGLIYNIKVIQRNSCKFVSAKNSQGKLWFGRITRLVKRDGINRHLCDVLNKVLAEGKSAAYEPHGNNMMGQRYDILVESRQQGTKGQGASVHPGTHAAGVKVPTWKG